MSVSLLQKLNISNVITITSNYSTNFTFNVKKHFHKFIYALDINKHKCFHHNLTPLGIIHYS